MFEDVTEVSLTKPTGVEVGENYVIEYSGCGMCNSIS